jgi:hypothetical protein
VDIFQVLDVCVPDSSSGMIGGASSSAAGAGEIDTVSEKKEDG